MMSCKRSLIAIVSVILVIFYVAFRRIDFTDLNRKPTKNLDKHKSSTILDKFNLISRDFFRYQCANMKRIGGQLSLTSKVPNELFRTEGAWFVCFDEGIAPVKDHCTILSFGINVDESFDKVLNTEYGCRIESFDPLIESQFFKDIRKKDNLGDQVTVKVNDKWRFHRMGICGPGSIKNVNQLGWLTTFQEILKYTGLTNQVIDVVKMDIENGEWDSFKSFDYEYICKYVKQFMIETHIWKIKPGESRKYLNFMRKLEKCFLLFRRDTRFYQEFVNGPYGFQKTEFQEPKTYKIDLKSFKDEIDIIDFLVTFGELYFVNEKFL